MKIAVLSRSPDSYSTRRLVQSAESKGHDVRVMDTLRFSVSLEEEYPDLYYRGRPVDEDMDAVLPRIGASISYFGTSVVRQFEQMDVFSANSALGISNSRDKLRALQILSRYDIGIPPTDPIHLGQSVEPVP